MNPETKKLCIALVDDEPWLCELCSLVLTKNGYDVVFVGNSGEEILSAITEGKLTKDNLDIVLLDFRMEPGMHGLETARRISERIPAARKIIMTADTSVESEVLASGLSFLAKPFSIKEFLNLISHNDVSREVRERTTGKVLMQ